MELIRLGPYIVIEVYNCTNDAPNLILSYTSLAVSMPPTPINTTSPLASFDKNFRTLFDVSFKGKPDKPPFSLLFLHLLLF